MNFIKFFLQLNTGSKIQSTVFATFKCTANLNWTEKQYQKFNSEQGEMHSKRKNNTNLSLASTTAKAENVSTEAKQPIHVNN